jgi:hypothetical protein
MKKYIILSFVGALSLLSSCDYNDKYFDGLDDLVAPTNKLTLDYTLTDADYTSISTLSANKLLAPHGSDSIALSKVKTNLYLSDVISAQKFVPAFLATKWYSASEGAAIKVTYKKSVNLPDYVAKLSVAPNYAVSVANYKTIWGANSSVNFFTPSKPAATNLPAILASTYPSAVNGDIVAVNYNESASEPTIQSALSEDFEAGTVGNVASIAGWANVTTVGTYSWSEKTFSSNKYIQATAYNHASGALEMYMVSPSFTVTAGQVFSFDACLGNYKPAGGTLTVLISSNLAGTTASEIAAATWDDVTSNFTIPVPTGTYGTLGKVGELLLSKYVGKKVNIAFRYNGDNSTGATTTVQVDNVSVALAGGSYTTNGTLYTFNGTKWVTYTGNGYFLTKADFATMGSKYDNFSSSMPADNYIPQFLKLKYPYAQEGNTMAVVYKYYTGSATGLRTDEYIYTAGSWVKNDNVEQFTDQFVYTNGKWVYNPSVVIELKPGKGQPAVAAYYQAIADYVGKTYGAGYYQTNFTNAECYYGSSAYYNEFDFRPSFIRTGSIEGVTAYASLDDEALVKLMVKRLPEALMHALEALYPAAQPVSGIDVTYTIKFGVYTGTTISAPNYIMVYKVTGTGKFEYVANSLKAL